MIDGFGWFPPADYKRSWLGFDEVDYLLPPGPLVGLQYPHDIRARRTYTAVSWQLPGSVRDQTISAAVRESFGPWERVALSQATRDDLAYAHLIALSDPDFADLPDLAAQPDGRLALLLLAYKLLAYCEVNDAVPLVGRRYAQRFLATKLRGPEAAGPDGDVSRAPRVPRDRQPALVTLAPATTLDFVDDETLVSLDDETLVRFKDDRRPLLARAQAELIGAVLAMQSTAPADVEQAVAATRADYATRALVLRQELTDAWMSAGLPVSRDKIGSASAAVLGAISGGGVVALLTDNLWGVVGGLVSGLVLSGAEVAIQRTKLRRSSVAYFVDLSELRAI